MASKKFYKISDDCMACGSCAANCPGEAIDMGDEHYVIDQDKCLQCGSCKDGCPAEAIIELDSRPED